MRVFIFLLMFSTPLFAQAPSLKIENSLEVHKKSNRGEVPSVTKFSLHAKVDVTHRCNLYVLLDQESTFFWFMEIPKPDLIKKEHHKIDSLLKNQKNLIKKAGLILPLQDLFYDIQTFEYVETLHDNSNTATIVHYINQAGKKVSTVLPLPKIYNQYTDFQTTFVYDDNNRACIEEASSMFR